MIATVFPSLYGWVSGQPILHKDVATHVACIVCSLASFCCLVGWVLIVDIRLFLCDGKASFLQFPYGIICVLLIMVTNLKLFHFDV